MARIAKSLAVLRSEFDALAPGRKKTRDGWIGDPAHAARASRHNANAEGVVCALDITDDVAGGCPVHLIAASLVDRLQKGGSTNPDFEYVISNGRIASRTSGWVWVAYHGPDPHDLHCHFAVGRGPDSAPAVPYDDTIPWNIANNTVQEDTMSAEDVKAINEHTDTVGGNIATNIRQAAIDIAKVVADNAVKVLSAVAALPADSNGNVSHADVIEAVKQALRDGTGN